jgi:predicted ester cyclase
MTAESNKIVMRHFLEFINTASESLAQELISLDAIFHVPGRPEPMRGPAGYLAIIGMMRGGFPDIQWTLEEMVAEGERWPRGSQCRAHIGVHFSASRRREKQSRYRP